MSPRRYQPSEPPPVDGAEVVLLRGIDPRSVSDYMRNAEHAPHVVVNASDAQLVAKLWRALPDGQQARCHIPTYGLRFRRSDTPILEASICWESHNTFGHDTLGELHFGFDGPAAAAQELVQLLFAVLPAPTR